MSIDLFDVRPTIIAGVITVIFGFTDLYYWMISISAIAFIMSFGAVIAECIRLSRKTRRISKLEICCSAIIGPICVTLFHIILYLMIVVVFGIVFTYTSLCIEKFIKCI